MVEGRSLRSQTRSSPTPTNLPSQKQPGMAADCHTSSPSVPVVPHILWRGGQGRVRTCQSIRFPRKGSIAACISSLQPEQRVESWRLSHSVRRRLFFELWDALCSHNECGMVASRERSSRDRRNWWSGIMAPIHRIKWLEMQEKELSDFAGHRRNHFDAALRSSGCEESRVLVITEGKSSWFRK